MYIFSTMPILLDLQVPIKVSTDKFRYFFGEDYSIDDRDSAHTFLKEKMDGITATLEAWVNRNSTLKAIQELYAVLIAVQKQYKKDREQRQKLKEIGAQDDGLSIFESNRNIALCIIDATNIWIENTVLLSTDTTSTAMSSSKLDIDLLLDLYIYGLVSRNLSLIALSNKFKDCKSFRGFSGIRVALDSEVPVEPLFNHPIIYTSTLVTGNQSGLSHDKEYASANESPLGMAFKKEYNTEILHFGAMMYSINKSYGHTTSPLLLSIADFMELIKSSVKVSIDCEKIFNAFTLSKEKLVTTLKKGDHLIWRSGVNKFRLEICPFILYQNNYVIVLPVALERSHHLWTSYILNGGSIYTDYTDSLTKASEDRNNELSNRLVVKLRNILLEKYPNCFCDTEVLYDRIWDIDKYPRDEYDYGDYDVIFFDKTENELFLIEAKFFSDALHASRMVSDYERLFSVGGYYEHCRKRYDLFLSDKPPMKKFIGASDKVIKVHMLFVSSKQLEVEFQDEDEIVTFLCLENFTKYINGKLLSEVDESIIVRPTRSI